MDAGAIAYVLTALFLAAFTKGVTGLGVTRSCGGAYRGHSPRDLAFFV